MARHFLEAVALGVINPSLLQPKNNKSSSYNMTTVVQSLSPYDPWYQFVENKFIEGWVHPDKVPPSIHNILLLHRTTYDVYAHAQYRNEVQARRGDANIQYQFHGTDRTCWLGDSNNALNLCYRSECSLCSILRSSFDISLAGSKHGFKRFGNGIYASSASSKADSYSDTNVPSRRYHAMILAEIVVGSTKELHRNARQLTAPPWGYDSVTGMPSNRGLKYPETVVYRREAICPTAVVIYQRFDGSDDCDDSDDSDDSDDADDYY